MKAVIDGLRYNTATAEFLGEDGWSGSTTDWQWWEAGLYRTPRKRYFLAGRGGPLSQFSKPVGQNGWIGGSGIIPMSIEEAREWAEDHLTAREVEAAFAAVIEDA